MALDMYMFIVIPDRELEALSCDPLAQIGNGEPRINVTSLVI